MADAIAPAGMHILCIAMRYIYNKPNKLEIKKASYLLLKLALQFYSWNIDILNYKILSPIRIPIFSSELASSFIDSGVGPVLSVWFVLAVVLNSENKFIVPKLTVWVWCGVAIMNGVYRCLLTNRLHGKAAARTMFGFNS